MLQVCRGMACTINGAEDIMAYFSEKLGVGHLQTTDDGLFSYEEVECLAACDRATCMQVNLEFVYDLTPQKIDEMLSAMRAGTYAVAPMAQTATPGRTLGIGKTLKSRPARNRAARATCRSPTMRAGSATRAASSCSIASSTTTSIASRARANERRGSRAVTETVDEEAARAGH